MTELDPRARQFTFLQRLQRLQPAERARLKRAAWRLPGEARADALGLFYSLLPTNTPSHEQDVYFLVASLYPLVDDGGSGDFGVSLRRARNPKNANGLDRRVISLLDADEVQLTYRLRQALHFLESNRVRVNWPGLLADLLAWNYPNRPVQRRWAQSYFQA